MDKDRFREGSGKAWIGQGGMDDRQQGKAQAILRHFLVNRTSPVLVNSEREGLVHESVLFSVISASLPLHFFH